MCPWSTIHYVLYSPIQILVCSNALYRGRGCPPPTPFPAHSVKSPLYFTFPILHILIYLTYHFHERFLKNLPTVAGCYPPPTPSPSPPIGNWWLRHCVKATSEECMQLNNVYFKAEKILHL